MRIFEEASHLAKSRQPFVIVTMLSGRGHTPQDPGAKIIVTADRLYAGTIGGGKVEACAIKVAQEMLAQKPLNLKPQLKTWNLQRDIGMSCGGEGTYLFELHFSKNWEVAIFGAGHVAQSLARTLITLECAVTCVDSRPEWIERLPCDPKLTSIVAPNPERKVQDFSKDTFFVVMTQGHSSDVPILKEIFQRFSNAPYIGVIGSQLKALKIKTELEAFGISQETLSRLRCPMGLALGTNHLGEIAISIAAELIQLRERWLSFSRAAESEPKPETTL